MKKVLLVLFVLISLNLFSQTNDTIILKTGEIIPCQIDKISSSGVVTYHYIDSNGNSVMTQKGKAFIQEIKDSDSLFIIEKKKSKEIGADNGIEPPRTSVGEDTISYPEQENYIISLSHRTKPKLKSIETGKKVTIWCGDRKIKGDITLITPDSICIDSIAYTPDQITKLRAFVSGSPAAGGTLIAVGTGGLLVGGLMAIGVAEMMAAADVLSGFAGLILIPIAGLVVVGSAMIFTSGILILSRGSTFDLVNKWKLSVVNQRY